MCDNTCDGPVVLTHRKNNSAPRKPGIDVRRAISYVPSTSKICHDKRYNWDGLSLYFYNVFDAWSIGAFESWISERIADLAEDKTSGFTVEYGYIPTIKIDVSFQYSDIVLSNSTCRSPVN